MPETPEQVVANWKPEEARQYGEMLERLAIHMSDRINYAEGRRASLSTNASGLLAAGIAILALVKDVGLVRVPLVVLSLGLILTGLATLVLYVRQTNLKTFLQIASVTRPWKWFYRDALIDSSRLTGGWYGFQRPQARAAAGQAFDNQWPQFADRFLTLSDPHVNAIQNLRQVFLLHANERYKNQHLSELRNVFNWGAISSVAAFIVALAVVGVVNLAASGPPIDSPSTDSEQTVVLATP